MLEDTPEDAELNAMALRDAGLSFVSMRVQSRDTFTRALHEFRPHLILSDFRLPAFDGHEALRIARQEWPQAPVIMVTGAVGDELAVELLRAGARDYVLKDRLARLPSAVQRALTEEQESRKRQAAEHALKESEALHRSFIAASPDGVGVLDAHGRVIYASPKIHELLDLGRSVDLRGHDAHQWIAPEDRSRAIMNLARHARGEPVIDADYRLLRADQTSTYVEINGAPIVEGTSELKGIVIVMRDTTARRRAVEDLRQSEQKYRTLFEESFDGLFIASARGDIVDMNRKGIEVLGYGSKDEALRLNLAADVYANPGTNERVLELVEAQGTAELETDLRKKSGERLVAHCALTAVKDPLGHLESYRGVIRDITEKKRAELSLRRTNHALKTLSSGNEALVRANSEPALLDDMCQVLVTAGGYRAVWIGYVEPGGGPMHPRAWAGQQEGWFSPQRCLASGADDDPVVVALRTGLPRVTRDMGVDPAFGHCREDAQRAGLKASVTLPLRNEHGVLGALTIYSADPESVDDEELKLLVELASDLTYGVQALRTRIDKERGLFRIQATMEATIQALANTVELRDPYTAGHQQRVARLATAMAHRLAVPEERIRGLRLAAMVHDIGKIHIPAEILSRPGKLSAIEYQIVQTHVEAGYEILRSIDFPWPIAEMVRQHHEHLDGTGYPRGLAGDAILPDARILIVADVVEAMSAHRPYRPGLGPTVALAEIESGSGTRYGPEAARVCLDLFREEGFHLD